MVRKKLRSRIRQVIKNLEPAAKRHIINDILSYSSSAGTVDGFPVTGHGDFMRRLKIPPPATAQQPQRSIDTVATDRLTAKQVATKQMGDACEMLVAAELTLAGVPAFKLPDNWPGYDVIAQPPSQTPQRVSVKARTFKSGNFVGYDQLDVFDWLAIVILPGPGCEHRRIFILPRLTDGKETAMLPRKTPEGEDTGETLGYDTTNRPSGYGYGFYTPLTR